MYIWGKKALLNSRITIIHCGIDFYINIYFLENLFLLVVILCIRYESKQSKMYFSSMKKKIKSEKILISFSIFL